MNDRFKFRTYIPDLKFFKYWGWIEDNHYVGLCACGDYQMPELLEKYTKQCAGLKDKNGKLIYMGDIVSIDDGELKGIVQTHDKLDEYYGCVEIKLIRKHPTIYKPTVLAESEIIGNIYENKELLNEN